jgi:hypothetical protein
MCAQHLREISDLVEKATQEVDQALEALSEFGKATIEAEKATIIDKLARSGYPREWYIVECYGLIIFEQCLSYFSFAWRVLSKLQTPGVS